MEYTIDATGKKLGRLATEVAMKLMGKNSASYERHTVPKNKVTVLNTTELVIDEAKKRTKAYSQYSGYPGGLKMVSMEKQIAKGGARKVVELAVYGMLPSNKLRPIMMKNLTIKD